jgi:bifunctional non-homologous end joining protein LigD
VKPMLAVAGALPTGTGWAFECKWDGVRALADLTTDGMQITGRSERPITTNYPELYHLADACPDALLDGEIVAFADGRPSFGALQPRMHVSDPAAARKLAATTPVTFLIFDVLRLYGVDLTARPYAERRETLERIGLDGAAWTVPPAFDDGAATLKASRAQGLEGVVAKRATSRYRPGARSADWVKVRLTHRQAFVVGGYEVGSGGRTNQIGSLVLGYHDAAGALQYAGQVGSGLTGAALRTLQSLLEPLHQEAPPFASAFTRAQARGVRWCAPQVVVDVEYIEWTDGGRLRHPTYRGIRTDKEARDVHRE